MPIKAEWIEFNIENVRLLSSDLVGVYECGYKRGSRVLYIGKGNLRANLSENRHMGHLVEGASWRPLRASEAMLEHAPQGLLTTILSPCML